MGVKSKADPALLGKVLVAVQGICLPPVRLEMEIVREIRRALGKAHIRFTLEAKIAPRCRVDILTEGGIVIEVKKGKPNTKRVAEQVQRYAAGENVTAVVLVSERGLIDHIDEAHGKPIKYVALSKNWGIAL